jgi:hypothetical protein
MIYGWSRNAWNALKQIYLLNAIETAQVARKEAKKKVGVRRPLGSIKARFIKGKD